MTTDPRLDVCWLNQTTQATMSDLDRAYEAAHQSYIGPNYGHSSDVVGAFLAVLGIDPTDLEGERVWWCEKHKIGGCPGHIGDCTKQTWPGHDDCGYNYMLVPVRGGDE